MSEPDRWEKLTPGRSAQIRREWGLEPRPAPAPLAFPADPPPARSSDAACPDHEQRWACGCPGCGEALG